MIELINEKFENIPNHRFGKIDLIICDPPDNIGLKYNGFVDKQPTQQYVDNLRVWLTKMTKITSGPIFLTFNEKWTGIIEDIIEQIKVPLIQRLHWYYTFGQDQTSKGKYALCYRPIYWLNSDFVIPNNIKVPSARQTKYNDKRAASCGKMPENIWQFHRICGTHAERRKHCPTQLPEALVRRIIAGHCLVGGKVLDPFMGSATTAIVCQRLGIDCITSDVSELYIQKAREILKIEKCE